MCFILLTRTESLSQLLPCQYALLVITIPYHTTTHLPTHPTNINLSMYYVR